ncbi:transcription antitermination protein NusB [Spiroplasma corruscae]|uniref:Transcription antitermination protein NusB n=1 Tax=Spiroplasma corruscae TaxID=216934 RepID=A0A222EP25_9MOLU|nr:transcription antitermination factor NusB [Spiroplasma corruscae]ASP28258.1 transcription antitermination protein NusB [Spiroplasma corruscae]
MNSTSINYLKKRRQNTIQLLYRYFLLEEKTNIKQEVIDGFQLIDISVEFEEHAFKICDQLKELIELCENNLSENWKWKRIPNIIKAILINGAFEIKNNITPKTVVINESIDLSRSYLPSWETSFVNAILDKI